MIDFIPTIIQLSYLLAASLFILGLRNLGSPATARRGNTMASVGMLIAVVATLADRSVLNYELILAGIVVGSAIGAAAARTVKMTAMPQMVGIFNGLGGGASALVAVGEYWRALSAGETLGLAALFIIALGVLIGTVTFSGSMVAFGKLQGVISGAPILFPLQQALNVLLLVAFVAGSILFFLNPTNTMVLLGLIAIALVLGILFVIPIGGADMPVVVSLLNSFSGMAASAAGFVVLNNVLIVSGALVGAAGLILTQIMSKAMNRSIANILFSGFGTGDSTGVAVPGASDLHYRSIDAEEAAMVLAYARSVVIVPGYGMAVDQAQHAARDLAEQLQKRNVDVKYAIHPVAGRMPGHMNVLLAEANVPYPQLYDMDDINPDFERTDVALVIGANDVVNPAARDSVGSPIYGMPILEVDHARSVIVIKRSMNPGFAGIDNELFYKPNTMMLFGSAKDMLTRLVSNVKEL